MAEEAAVDQTPEVPVTEPEVSVPEVSFTPQVVIDTSGYDLAIEAAEDLRQYVPEDDLPALDSRIAKLQVEKAKAQSSGEAEELAGFRRQAEDSAITKILEGTGLKANSIQGNTPQERLAAAKLVAEAVAPWKEKVDAVTAPGKAGEPTPEQIAAHGTPLVPSGEPVSSDDIAKLKEAVNTGDLRGTMENPAMKSKLNKLVGNIFG